MARDLDAEADYQQAMDNLRTLAIRDLVSWWKQTETLGFADAKQLMEEPFQAIIAAYGEQAAYAAAGVQAETVPFIDDMAQAFADADWVICRAGAATVTELAAVGAAALFVPFPYAVDDHQSANARFLTDAGAGQLIQQADLTPQKLARLLGSASRSALLKQAQAAREKQKTGAAQAVADACQELCQP